MDDGTLIQGRYLLRGLLGRGGMGEVWRATDTALERDVAVKCVRPAVSRRDAATAELLEERFRREAKVAARLQHPGITVVHDFGEDRGVLYLVMELLAGANLGTVLDGLPGRRMDVADAVSAGGQIASALAYTHAKDVVHRDLKPANVVRLPDGTVKICDFGIARLGGEMGLTRRATAAGPLGSPHYMSPEQIAGEDVDHRSDLYSFGCVLYELLTGAPPFDLGDPWAIMLHHRDSPPEPLRAARPEVPDGLERLVLDLLAKSPDDRPQDADEAEARLAGCGYAGPPAATRPRVALTRASRGAEPPALPAWAGVLAPAPLTNGALATAAGPETPPELLVRWPSPPEPAGPRGPGPATGGGTGAEADSETVTRLLPSFGDTVRGLPEAADGEHQADSAVTVLAPLLPPPPADRSAAMWAEPHGADHPGTLAARYEAAFALARTGRPERALAEHREVADARERALGADHPETLRSRQEVAYTLAQLGRCEEADAAYRAVLAARERVQGAGHPDALRCRHNLGVNLGRLGRQEASYRCLAEAADGRARVLGEDDPDTLATRHELGCALGRLGRWEEALDVFHAVGDARTRVLGADHPETVATRYEAAIALGRLRRCPEAVRVYREVADARARLLGPDDPETLRARHGLGVNLGRLGRWEEALAEARSVGAARARVLGPEHPDTLVSLREEAVALGRLDRWQEALECYRRVALGRARVLGPDDPLTLAVRNDEAHCLERLGRAAEAVALYRTVAAGRTTG